MVILIWYMYIIINLSYIRFKFFVKKIFLLWSYKFVFFFYILMLKNVCVCMCVFCNRLKYFNFLYSGSVFNVYKFRYCYKFKLYELI